MQLAGSTDLNQIAEVFSNLSEDGQIGFDRLLTGTWSAVLLTPLSVAGEHISGQLALNMGKDYLDSFLSIPPGFIANALGYTRPINEWAGPAWEVTYGKEARTQWLLLFLTFVCGAFCLHSQFLSLFFSIAETEMLQRINVHKLAFLCIAVAVAPTWLWYGEKYAITGILIWALFSIMHRAFAKRCSEPRRIAEGMESTGRGG